MAHGRVGRQPRGNIGPQQSGGTFYSGVHTFSDSTNQRRFHDLTCCHRVAWHSNTSMRLSHSRSLRSKQGNCDRQGCRYMSKKQGNCDRQGRGYEYHCVPVCVPNLVHAATQSLQRPSPALYADAGSAVHTQPNHPKITDFAPLLGEEARADFGSGWFGVCFALALASGWAGRQGAEHGRHGAGVV